VCIPLKNKLGKEFTGSPPKLKEKISVLKDITIHRNILEMNQALHELKDVYELEQLCTYIVKFRIFANLLPTNNFSKMEIWA